MNELAEEYEGFAGIWMDPDDQEHIYISLANGESKLSDRNASVNRLTDLVKQNLSRPDLPDTPTADYRFTIVEAEFAHQDLQYYRDFLTPILLQRKEFGYSYISNSSNQLIVGLTEGSEKNEFSTLLNTYSIPIKAVSFITSNPDNSFTDNINKDSSTSALRSFHTIRDFHRPLTGGFKIERTNGFGCTMGFNVKLDEQEMWVTHSFCSNQFSSTGSTDFYQEEAAFPTDLVGTEFRDFLGSANFRSSAAVLVETDFATNANFGKIARTKDIATGWGNSGSTELADGTQPPFVTDPEYFDIVAENQHNSIFLMEGMNLDKVGQATGRTRGEIVSPCSTVSGNDIDFASNWTFTCQIISKTYAEAGDRGAPAFLQITFADDIELVGILAGRLGSTQYFYYSPMQGIRDDLVNFNETMTVFPNQ
jgi:hypothetical protein